MAGLAVPYIEGAFPVPAYGFMRQVMQSAKYTRKSYGAVGRRTQTQLMIVMLCAVMVWTVASHAAITGDPVPALLDPDHPLVDRILEVHTGEFLNQTQLFARLTDWQYILLGETHDNRRHHEIQAQIIDALHAAQRQASVSFEMINDEQDMALRTQQINSVTALIEVLRGIEDKWPYARDYQIVFERVLRAGYAIRPANLRQGTIRQIVREDEAELPDNIRQQLQHVQFSAKQRRALEEDIVSAHCDMLPAASVKPMVRVQRVRDAAMSLSLLESSAPVRVLIAGAGHVRKDLGVPFYLRTSEPQARILALGLIEVRPGSLQAEDYTYRWGSAQLPFDYVWFTPRAERADPCAELRNKMHGSRPAQ